MKRLTLAALGLLAYSGLAGAADLVSVYQDALEATR